MRNGSVSDPPEIVAVQFASLARKQACCESDPVPDAAAFGSPVANETATIPIARDTADTHRRVKRPIPASLGLTLRGRPHTSERDRGWSGLGPKDLIPIDRRPPDVLAL